MSRVAKYPVIVPPGVSVTIEQHSISIKGSKGSLRIAIHPSVTIEHSSDQIRLAPKQETSSIGNMQAATARAVINNSVVGVSEGFVRKLNLIGVGYRAQVQGKVLNLTLGFSHPIVFKIPEGITIETPTQTEVVIKGCDRQLVGQVAANIRSYRPPEPYKGKGVRYENEKVVLKETKKK